MQADPKRVSEFLFRLIEPHLAEEGLAWLREKREQIAEGAEDWIFFTSFSAAPRYTRKADLQCSEEDLIEAEAIRAGWRPDLWSVDQAGRAVLILASPSSNAQAYVDRMEQVFVTADVGELIALYQTLPVLPHHDRFIPRAAEGLRSSITPVFNAVALNNPFPADYFEEPAWNQMVLKAVFVGSPLHQIEGLDRRANPTLARMLVDYAHERWAASRSLTPELWRPVGPFADEPMVADLERVLVSDDAVQQRAAALALAQSKSPGAIAILARHPELRRSIDEGALSWHTLAGYLEE